MREYRNVVKCSHLHFCLHPQIRRLLYFGGNCAQTDIVSENSTSGESILVLKDSFANSFVPYLTEHYENITMIDTRYYQGDIASLAGSFDRVLFLYSITSLSEQKLHLTQTLLQ